MSDKFTEARRLLIDSIRPALQTLSHGGRAAEQLVLGTAIQESLLIHRRQLGNGPAVGLFQMEPATHDDCWTNFLKFRSDLAALVRSTLAVGEQSVAETMVHNDRYAAAMCRVRYLRARGALPAADDVSALAAYWKLHYNTPLGAGTSPEFIAKWAQYVKTDTFL